MEKLPKCTKAIRVMYGDPKSLKCKVDEYVWVVKGHLALKESLSDRHHSDQVEEERLSTYDATLTKHKVLEEESVALKKKEYELLKELEDVHQRMKRVTNDLGDNKSSLTTLEATVHATKRHVEELKRELCAALRRWSFLKSKRGSYWSFSHRLIALSGLFSL
ncbi:Tropomyosin, partial [Bienertia sinuspersici]